MTRMTRIKHSNDSNKSSIRVATSVEEQIGKIIHYYDKIGVGVVRLEGPLNVGDTVHVKGSASDFEQAVSSMQLNHESIKDGKKGDEIAVKLDQKAKEGDVLYKKP